MLISVIIPVFNAAATLEASLNSLSRQSFRDFEIVAVDDCSTDSSAAILASFKEKFDSGQAETMRIVTHEANQGVAAARNSGLDAAKGKYVMFLDADDILPEIALERVASLIGHSRAELVGWDWKLIGANGARYMKQPLCTTPEQALKALLAGRMRWNLWLFAATRALWGGTRFTPGYNMGEDMMAMIKLLCKAGSFAQEPSALYHYIQNEASISRTMSKENLRQVKANLKLATIALRESKYKLLEYPYLDFLKLSIKLPLLVSTDKNDYIRWSECYPESNGCIWQNPYLPFRTKLLQWCAAKRLWVAVSFYNKLVYGILLKAL